MYDRVVLASPFAGRNPAEKSRNKKYLRRAIRDSIIKHHEAPFASHELYTRALADNEPHERHLGQDLLLAWFMCAHKLAVYADLGISSGMKLEIDFAVLKKVPIEYRYINRKPRG